MTKGQRIIGSLLVVVAGLLALNLSLEVGGQDVWHEETFALDEIRQAIKDASWAASRDMQAMIEANKAAQQALLSEFNRSFEPGPAGIPSAAQNWPPPPSPSRSSGDRTWLQSELDWLTAQLGGIHVDLTTVRKSIEAERVQAAIQRDWVRKRLVRLRQIIEPKFGLPPSAYAPRGPGVVGQRPGHPDLIVETRTPARSVTACASCSTRCERPRRKKRLPTTDRHELPRTLGIAGLIGVVSGYWVPGEKMPGHCHFAPLNLLIDHLSIGTPIA